MLGEGENETCFWEGGESNFKVGEGLYGDQDTIYRSEEIASQPIPGLRKKEKREVNSFNQN